jgi:hypothetical protein
LKEIVQRLKDIIKEGGYETESKDSTLSPAVQNCLAKLRKEETVTKDQETRRFSLKVA